VKTSDNADEGKGVLLGSGVFRLEGTVRIKMISPGSKCIIAASDLCPNSTGGGKAMNFLFDREKSGMSCDHFALSLAS
jgi:hypothetical protein